MRSILDVCLCGAGKLLPRSYGVTATRCYSTNRNDHSSVIDYLSCNACGLRYDAKEEGESLYYLRQTAHRHAIELNQKPDQCVFCASTKIAAEEAIFGNGIASSRDPRKHPKYAFCETCNSSLGRLPVDPLLVAEYEQWLKNQTRELDNLN